jgi:chemotaxis protein histidine kinase CheA
MAVDGSLIFNTKIDTSGLNSDIAKINKAIAQAQSKAQSGARQTAQTAKQQADKSVQAAENSAKREITATQEKAEQAQNSAKQTAQATEKVSESVEQSAENVVDKVESTAKRNTEEVSKSTNDTCESVKKSVSMSAKKAKQSLQTVRTAVDRLQSKAKMIGRTLLTAFGTAAVVSFGKKSIELGSDLAKVQNVVDVTFSHMSAKVDDWAKSAQNAYGLSETMAKKYVGTFGSMAEAFGFTEQQAFNMSTALTALTGDVASFYNITQDEAYTKLKSVFSGETETLKDLGIVMTQNALDNYAMANGWGKTTSAMTEEKR